MLNSFAEVTQLGHLTSYQSNSQIQLRLPDGSVHIIKTLLGVEGNSPRVNLTSEQGFKFINRRKQLLQRTYLYLQD